METGSAGADPTPISLVDCGLEELLSALLAGHPVAIPSGGEPFVLRNDDSRRILSYYARHRDLWPRAKTVQAREIEDILNALADEAPAPKEIKSAASAPRRLWRLRRIEAHRIAGLHRHCGAQGEDPEDFALDIERDVTLISGFNGAGKTALQNVIIWCLTGKALRSQHMPDDVHEPMEVYRTAGDGDDETQGRGPGFTLPPIVPIPSGGELEALGDRPRIDTWAQLTFHAEGSDEICVVRRTLSVSDRGRISMSVTGLEDLGLPEVAIEAGTLMPGIAAHMRFDEKTTFAQAVAQLTGLKPLEDLGRRSTRVVKRLRTDERKKTENDASQTLGQFKRKRQAIHDAWSAQPDLGDPASVVAPDEETSKDQSKNSISDARKRLEKRKMSLESASEAIIGQALQLASKQDVDGMLQQLRAAADLLTPAALGGLPSVALIKSLRAATGGDIGTAECLIVDMVSRATAVAERLRNKQEAARWQLYTKVAAWHREHHEGAELENCPVCGTDLDDVPPDALVDNGVKDALRLCAEADADAAKGAVEWEQDAAREFLERLPETLRAFADKAPPAGLLDIYRKAYLEELLADRTFGGRLQGLGRKAAPLWEVSVTAAALRDMPAAKPLNWPEEFKAGLLATRVGNIVQAIRLSKHRSASADALKKLVERYIGVPTQPETGNAGQTDAEETQPDKLPLREQIETLRMCVENTAPIVSLLRQFDELETSRKQYATYIARLALIDRAADAMEEFAGLENLVFQQVSGLIQILDQGTKEWLGRIYSPHYLGGPSYSGFDATEEKGIGLRAGIGDMQVPAHKIMNSSLLRACVWAFVFSLWERVRSNVGGIDCMLLDDPQTHFDPINAENLAAAIPDMPAHNMRPVITSNDYRFLAAIRDKLPRQSTVVPSWHALVINPISSSRLTAAVSPAVEEIYELQKDWQADENNAAKAQQFMSKVRLYVENRLWDLLATDPMVMHKPTLADLVNALRSARSNGERPFDEAPFEALLSHVALRNTAPFYTIINKAHHRLHEITPYEAEQVSEVFDHIDRLLRSCSAAYARFMGRLTREDRDLFLIDTPPAPAPVALAKTPLPLLGEVSARSSANVLALAQPGETFNLNELGEIALYGVRSPGLGSFALQGQVVIVSLEQEAGDGDPVIALSDGKIYLRRLLADRRDPSRVVLACDRTGTDRVPPTLVLPRSKTRLLPVAGVLYDQESFDGREEACPIDASKILDRTLVAARVTDDSAYPIIRSGDIVLLEAVKSLSADEIARLEDRIVVATTGATTDSFAFLKRLGGEISPGVRILENVGIKGSALAVSIRAEFAADDIPTLQTLWRVHGVLRLA
ncbi:MULTISPECIES: AAA family ATPase [unclassified Citromicrobium]|uniref:AAA family ATPase n=1 Tax=unclassified Citromicrobium TaxID=2630544 RepID=UPI0006C92C81|nr:MULTISPECIES: ATP-binding protein [unclassified Citromicrobium]